MIVGRPSIFWISLTISVLCFGLMMIYFIIFSDIAKSLAQQMMGEGPDTTKFFASKTCYVLVLAFMTLPFIIRKELKELKIASLLLFGGVTAFILIFTF